jgi:hypothetical protein
MGEVSPQSIVGAVAPADLIARIFGHHDHKATWAYQGCHFI